MRSIPLLGELTQDLDIPEWWESAPVPVPFFSGKALPFVVEEEWQGTSYPAAAHDAVAAFLALGDADRLAISDQVHANYRHSAERTGDGDPKVDDPLQIWNHVTPVEIHLRRRLIEDRDFYIQIDCNCDWEKDHGLQIVLRRGNQLVRVSDQDGHLTDEDAAG